MTAFVDAHVHPPVVGYLDGPISPYRGGLESRGYDLAPLDPDDLIGYYEQRDARAVLLGWDSESVTNIRPYSSRDVASLVHRDPERFWGLGAVDPTKGAAAVAQVHETARLGLAGISLNPAAQGGRGPADRTAFPVWEAAAEHDLICMFHTGSTIFGAGSAGGAGIRLANASPLHIDTVASRLPELRIVLTHGGTLWLDEALAVASHKSNVHLCLGGQSPTSLDEDALAVISGPLAHRVVFGSGFPFGEPDAWMKKWEQLDLPESLSNRIFRDNAVTLFGGAA